MKVLLISTNLLCDPIPVYPLGIGYLISSLRKSGHICAVFDFVFENDPESDLLTKITEFKPEAIGISIRNIDNICFLFQKEFISQIDKVVQLCRQEVNVPIVLGGSGFSIFPEEIMALTKADFGVIGEGEKVLPQLLECFEFGEDYSDLNGIVYAYDDKFIINKPRFNEEVDKLDFPDRNICNKQYCSSQKQNIDEISVFNIQSKRGCCFSCIYCTYPMIEGKKTRMRLAGNVANELMEMLTKHNVRQVDFVDSVFNYPLEHAKNVCKAICRKGININWTCFLHPLYVDEEIVELMLEAGCARVELGIDSLSSAVLTILKKGFEVNDVFKCGELLKSRGLAYSCSLIFGGPGETMETVKETMKNLDRLDPNAVFGLIGMRIYPNTELSRQLKIKNALLQPSFYISPDLDLEILKSYLIDRLKKHPNWTFVGVKPEYEN